MKTNKRITRQNDWGEKMEELEYKTEMRTEEEIGEYMEEAFDRVWLVGKQDMFCNMLSGVECIDADILEGCNNAIEKVCDKCNIDFKSL